MHRVVGDRIMRVVSLDSDPLAEDDDVRSLDRFMRAHPTPASERRLVRTSNGNLVVPVAR